ncbi:MAG: AraC family transcriptional regulator [Pseudomonadota bacterium]
MLAEIDLLIRGALVGVSFLCFIILWSSVKTRPKSYSMGAIAMCLTASMAIEQGMGTVWSEQARNVAFVLGHFMPLALTWFVMDIFLEKMERRGAGTALFVLAAFVTALCFAPAWTAPLHVGLNLLLYLGLLVIVMTTAAGDLVEDRRSFRVVFVSAVAIFGITKTLLDIAMPEAVRPEWYGTAHALALLAFAVVFAHWALRPGGDIWAEETPRQTPVAAELRLVDKQTLNRIEAAMADEIWRREGLTIGAMAEELRLPEHRLRKAINQDLGFRNFATFVNGYRIDAAKEALAAPERVEQTILEIAYDCGFASLAPFNKAFRAMTGKTPTDYRRDCLEGYASISA